MHGKGKLTFSDKIEYDGQFHQNAISGTGIISWNGGQGQYEGEVNNGLRHGTGNLVFNDTDVNYEGVWKQGLRHGQGTCFFTSDKTMFYEGDWEDDMKQGRGVMHYSSGDLYDGMWVQDMKQGHGIMTWTEKCEQYRGAWARNLPNGLGQHLWLQQVPSDHSHALYLMFNRYHGYFKDGKRHGYGIAYYATGARYEGFWAEDLKEGPGVVTFEDGSTFRGIFHLDRPVLEPGTMFGPESSGVKLNIEDVVAAEERPDASLKAVNNVLMCYNSELRLVYDKYCKRASIYLERNREAPGSFCMVTAQMWELLRDCRLIGAETTLARIDALMNVARQPQRMVQEFRHEWDLVAAAEAAMEGEDNMLLVHAAVDAAASESCQLFQGLPPHYPATELLFREFCEVIVRLAVVRHRALPGLERRLHQLINLTLLPCTGTKKGAAPPSKTPLEAALETPDMATYLRLVDPSLRLVFQSISSRPPSPAPVRGPFLDDEPDPFSDPTWRTTITARELLAFLKKCDMIWSPAPPPPRPSSSAEGGFRSAPSSSSLAGLAPPPTPPGAQKPPPLAEEGSQGLLGQPPVERTLSSTTTDGAAQQVPPSPGTAAMAIGRATPIPTGAKPASGVPDGKSGVPGVVPTLTLTAAAHAVCAPWINNRETSQRLRIEDDAPATARDSVPGETLLQPTTMGADNVGSTDEDMHDLICMLEGEMIYPDFVDAVIRCAEAAYKENFDILSKLRHFVTGRHGMLTNAVDVVGLELPELDKSGPEGRLLTTPKHNASRTPGTVGSTPGRGLLGARSRLATGTAGTKNQPPAPAAA